MTVKNALITAFAASVTSFAAYSQKPFAEDNSLKIECGRISTLTKVHQDVGGKDITVHSGYNFMEIAENKEILCLSVSDRAYTADCSITARQNKIFNEYKEQIIMVSNAVCPMSDKSFPHIDKTIEVTPTEEINRLARKMVRKLSK